MNVSVVIPTYNGRKLLEKHLPDVISLLQPKDEIVVVDDASTDDTLEWLENQKKLLVKKNIYLTIMAHFENQRFAAAVNSGVRVAQHDTIILLNNDVSPLSQNLRERTLQHLKNDQLFSVGYAEVQSIEKNATVFGRGTGEFRRGFLSHYYDPNQNNPKTLWTSGGSMGFSKQKYLELGGMDTLFYPAYEEDRDLSYRALKHGWKLIFDFDIRVLHQHESTNQSVFGLKEMEINSCKNQFLIVWKNVTDFDLLLQHIIWLPFHLTKTNIQTKGTIGQGFLRALKQFPQMLISRHKASKLFIKSDKEILNTLK